MAVALAVSSSRRVCSRLGGDRFLGSRFSNFGSRMLNAPEILRVLVDPYC